MQPVIPDIGSLTGSFDPLTAAISLLGSFVLGVLIAWVYKTTHRGLSYSQSFQFALVLLTMLGSVVMMIASQSLSAAIGLLGAFSLIRFRTAIKDPKDMAYILLVLSVGLAMGSGMYVLAGITTIIVNFVILILTWMNFGITSKHESVIRLMCKLEGEGSTETVANVEAQLTKLTDGFRMLSAHARGDRMELSYGARPKAKQTAASLLDALRKEKGVENAELFDAKHQVEF
jgi:uncharacterized membrane protein YhiD involved in acid resistance